MLLLLGGRLHFLTTWAIHSPKHNAEPDRVQRGRNVPTQRSMLLLVVVRRQTGSGGGARTQSATPPQLTTEDKASQQGLATYLLPAT